MALSSGFMAQTDPATGLTNSNRPFAFCVTTLSRSQSDGASVSHTSPLSQPCPE